MIHFPLTYSTTTWLKAKRETASGVVGGGTTRRRRRRRRRRRLSEACVSPACAHATPTGPKTTTTENRNMEKKQTTVLRVVHSCAMHCVSKYWPWYYWGKVVAGEGGGGSCWIVSSLRSPSRALLLASTQLPTHQPPKAPYTHTARARSGACSAWRAHAASLSVSRAKERSYYVVPQRGRPSSKTKLLATHTTAHHHNHTTQQAATQQAPPTPNPKTTPWSTRLPVAASCGAW